MYSFIHINENSSITNHCEKAILQIIELIRGVT